MDGSENGGNTGIAIIGMALRFPGAATPNEFWHNLCSGTESIRFFSHDELLSAGVSCDLINDRAYVKASPVLDDVDKFDAAFFGYSPKEATLMDPQNRLFLEVSWAAFEDAGYNPACLEERTVGVFTGGGSSITSYLLAYANHPDLKGQTAGLEHIANDRDFLSTRISYKLNLTGPSLTVQTACSTSLVAVHMACQSLISGECNMALAGASVVRVPHISGYVARKGSVHSADGHCRPFDARGQGTVFGSGVAALILKPLAVAIADRDYIYAVIRSAAITNDGSEKISFTAASSIGQARAIAEALTLANTSADTLQYVECHATGTPAGDPVEIEAFTRAFRIHTDRRGFCAVGSVKGNIGHAEQAAGMGGLIKTALSLKNEAIPPTVGFNSANRNIRFDESPFYIQTRLSPWTRNGVPRRAGVNSLGIGGTNAFVLLEESPPQADEERLRRPHNLFCLSAKSEAALCAQCKLFSKYLADNPSTDFDDVCFTASSSRSSWAHRFAAVSSSPQALIQKLDAFAITGLSNQKSVASIQRAQIAFVFSGQGSQYPAMGRELYEFVPEFQCRFDECDALAQSIGKLSLRDIVLSPNQDASQLINRTQYTQPALFAVEYALAHMWQSWGIRPVALIGHSVGEIVAACFGGALELRDALKFVIERGKRMQETAQIGGMEVFFVEPSMVQHHLAGLEFLVSVAAVNGPRNTVVSGERSAIDKLRERLASEGVRSRPVNVSHAFHSPLMDSALPLLERAAAEMQTKAPLTPLVSNLSGQFFTGAIPANYWRDHARGTVRFLDGIHTLDQFGCSAFLEIGPGNTFVNLAKECVDHSDRQWLSSINGHFGELRTLLESAARFYLNGCDLEWKAVYSGCKPYRVPLPTYPFERTRFWLSPVESGRPAACQVRTEVRPTSPDTSVELQWILQSAPYLADHKIYGRVVIPTMTITESVLESASKLWPGSNSLIRNFVCHEPLEVVDGVAGARLSFTHQQEDCVSFRIVNHDYATGREIEHMTGLLQRSTDELSPANCPDTRLERGRHFQKTLHKSPLYERLREIGLNYGTSFQGIRKLWQADGELIARVCGQASHLNDCLLDACLHAYPLLVENNILSQSRQEVYLPVAFESFEVYHRDLSALWSRVQLRTGVSGESMPIFDIHIYGQRRKLVAVLSGLCVKRISAENFAQAEASSVAHLLHNVSWRQHHQDCDRSSETPGGLLLFADSGPLAAAMAAECEARGHRCFRVRPGNGFEKTSTGWVIDPTCSTDYDALLNAIERSGDSIRRVVYLWGLDAPQLEDLPVPELPRAEILCGQAPLYLIQTMLRSCACRESRVWFVSRGAQTAGDATSRINPIQSYLWGFGRSIILELPQLGCGLVDLSPDSSNSRAEATRLCTLMGAEGCEQQLAFRGEITYVPRLTKARQAEESSEAVPIRSDATYLIAGGLGMLGIKMARWLIEERGARHLVLASRRGQSDTLGPWMPDADIRAVAADLSREEEVSRVFELIASEMPPLKGIVHAAGVLADGIVQQMDWDHFQKATAPKTHAAWALHRHSEKLRLDFFVLHSSLLSVTGSAGQSNYTAANAFLDALVDYRLSRGLPAIAINWGPWAGTGMAASTGARGELMWRRLGMRLIQPEQGSRVLDRLFKRPRSHVSVVDCDWNQFVRALPQSGPFLSELHESQLAYGSERCPTGPNDFASAITCASNDNRRTIVLDSLQHLIPRELGITRNLGGNERLDELGVDSLMAVTLTNKLENALGIRIPVSHLIQSPSIEELADVLTSEFESSAAKRPHEIAPQTIRRADTHLPLSNHWLVCPVPRRGASTRLFCFNFAGGSAAIYRPWADLLPPAIELIAIEAPGRGTRINERPVRTVKALLAGLIPAMIPYLDKPAAFVGHCLGGLNLFEVSRALVSRGIRPVHLFVSGSRPPHRVQASGTFEEALLRSLLEDQSYDPTRPLDEQPDDTFGKVIRHFNIGATDRFLAQEELRNLLLPAIRADFEMVRHYHFEPEPPWNVPITCFNGLKDPYVSREDAVGWNSYTSTEFRVYFRPGNHFLIVDDREFIVETIKKTL